jgi:N-acetylmuramoyl-L-alanine amidase
LNARPLSFTRNLLVLLLACVVAVAVASVHQVGHAQAPALQILSRDGRRSIPLVSAGTQEMVPLDELASAFQLAVRDDGGAITVGYKGRTIVLTPDQTIASVAGRLISLPAPPARVGGRWAVPFDFITRALAPIYDSRLELRRSSRLLIVGDVRVPRVTVSHEALAAAGRITLDITPAAAATVTQQGNQRLVVRVEAEAVEATIPGIQPTPFVQAVRILDTASVGIDLGPRFASYRSTTQPLDNATRIVIDIVGAQTDAAPSPAPSPATAAAAPPADALPRDLVLGPTATMRTVAIDAGHGGSDTGAKGTGGALEKDVALAIARRLRAAIESRLGLRVVMTRDDDRNVALADRVALANNNKADLFISVHANASFRPEVVGAAVYVASFSDAEIAQEGLAPERLPVFGGGLRDIEVVPWNLAQIRHRERSGEFATIAVEALGARVPLAARPIERAPLRVLEPANMPAVLLEVGYLTNSGQEQAITGADLQASIAQSLLDAIVRFRDRTSVDEGGPR